MEKMLIDIRKTFIVFFTALTTAASGTTPNMNSALARMDAGINILSKYCSSGQGSINCGKRDDGVQAALGCRGDLKPSIDENEARREINSYCGGSTPAPTAAPAAGQNEDRIRREFCESAGSGGKYDATRKHCDCPKTSTVKKIADYNGVKDITDCTACSDNYAADANQEKCVALTELVKQCGTGEYYSMALGGKCTACLSGKVPRADKLGCEDSGAATTDDTPDEKISDASTEDQGKKEAEFKNAIEKLTDAFNKKIKELKG